MRPASTLRGYFYYPNKVELTFISANELDDLLKLWRADNTLEDDKVANLPDKNRFKKYLLHNNETLPLKSIIKSARQHFDAFAVIETPYLDLEYWDSHGGFYQSSFTRYPLECERIHFFAGDYSERDRLRQLLYKGNYSDGDKIENFKYVGYTVLRPTKSWVVSRTAIAFDADHSDKQIEKGVQLLECEHPGDPFLKSAQKLQANLINCNFSIETAEFIQQDPNIGVCATASLWVSTHLMANIIGSPSFRYGALTREAVGNSAVSWDLNILHDSDTADEGLSGDEMKRVLESTGAKVLSTAPSSKCSYDDVFVRATHEIYTLVESGFPALLCMRNQKTKARHVVAAIGHSLPRLKSLENCPSLRSMYRGTALEEHLGADFLDRNFFVNNIVRLYYAHDDSYGPFNRIEFLSQKRLDEENHEAPVDEDGDKLTAILTGRSKDLQSLERVIIPRPSLIKARPQVLIPVLIHEFYDYRFCFPENASFLWRTLVVLGAQFKNSLANRSYAQEYLKRFGELHLPKYIWLCEVTATYREDCSSAFPDGGVREIDGEILFDATGAGGDLNLLAVRIAGLYTDYLSNFEDIFDGIEAERYPCFTG